MVKMVSKDGLEVVEIQKNGDFKVMEKANPKHVIDSGEHTGRIRGAKDYFLSLGYKPNCINFWEAR